MARYRCSVCNWVYDDEDERTQFGHLPHTYTCPVCGAPKTAFKPEGIVKGKENIETTVADKIVIQLEKLGIKYVYGIPGDSNLPLIEALRKRGKIRFILTRHEETAAFMASAHGKMTDHLGVCISIAGPGATNLITGLMDASNDRSPVLALVGQIPELYLGSEAFQEIDQIELFRTFTSFAETVARQNQALKLVMMAAKYVYKKPGVAVLSTPTDVLVDKLDEDLIDVDKRVFRNEVNAKDEDIQKAAELINKCNKIAILAGWGSRHAGDLLLELAEKLKAPIATTSRAKGVIHETNKYSLGVLGSIGTKHAAKAIQNAETLIIIGSGFRQANLTPPNVKLIQIDIDPTRVGKTFDVDVGIVGDGKLVLEKLVPLVEEKEKDESFFATISEMKEAHLKELEEDSKKLTTPIYPGYLIQAIQRNISKGAIICVDVGDHTYWFYKKFICEGQKTYFSANIASMGFGLPAALSAKLDFPDKQVICVTGDGGFGMLMADFTTAVRENLGIKVIVFNDSKLKNIKKEQLASSYPEYGVSFPNPNFAEFAKTSGGDGYRVENPADLNDVLKQSFASDKATIIDVVIDSDAMAHGTKKV